MNPKSIFGGAVALFLVGVGAFVLHRSTSGTSAPPPRTAATGATHSAPAPIPPSVPAQSPDSPIAATFGRPGAGQTLTVESFRAGSRLHADLNHLDSTARSRALETLSQMTCGPQDADSLQVDSAGGVFYACTMQVPPAPRAAAQVTAAAQAAAPTTAVALASTVPSSQPPIRHSRPGSSKVLYLDFNGHQITGTAWNLASGTHPAVATYECSPYDIDNTPGAFNDQEQADILEVWERVSEDYAPFDIDVTTEEPSVFTNQTARALITSRTDRNGAAMPWADTAPGVAYLDVFGHSNYSYHSPALIYFDKLYSYPAYIAEVVSHEVGHNLALSHDGITGGAEYYAGHGSGETSWAPIMGTGYSANLTQWSKGEYDGANNTEDDLQRISDRTGYAADDFGNNRASSTPMTSSDSTLSANGCLGTTGDADVFSFTTTGGSCSFSALPYRAPAGTRGGNADLKVLLLDSTGATLATSDSPDTTTAEISAIFLTGGTYYLKISAVGAGSPLASPPTGYTSYASLGRYHITGQLSPPPIPIITGPTSGNGTVGSPVEFDVVADIPVVSFGATGLPSGVSINPTTGRISGVPLQAGTFDITLTATNPFGTGTAGFALFIDTAPPVFTAQPSQRTVLAPGQTCVLSAEVTSFAGACTYTLHLNGYPISDSISPVFTVGPVSLDRISFGPSVSLESSGWYQIAAHDAYGTCMSDPAFVLVAPSHSDLRHYGDTPTPEPTDTGNLIALAAGKQHALGLRRDGSVLVWGANSFGQRNQPAGLTDVVAIAAGDHHSMALRADGTVAVWGHEDPIFHVTPADLAPPTSLLKVVAISANGDNCMALQSDGTVAVWGLSAHNLQPPPDLSFVAEIALGRTHAIARPNGGFPTAWGDNTYGQTDQPAGYVFPRVGAAGDGITIGLDRQSFPFAWNAGPLPQNLGALPSSAQGVPFRKIVLSDTHALGLRHDNTTCAWSGDPTIQPLLAGIEDEGCIWRIAAGYAYSYLLRDLDNCAPLQLLASPVDTTCTSGATAIFRASISGNPAPRLRWQSAPADAETWSEVSPEGHFFDTTTDKLVIVDVPFEYNGRRFRCTATSTFGAPVVSASASLTVLSGWTQFQADYFTTAELADPAVSGPAADPDADGLPNLLEYAFVHHPRQSESSSLLTLVRSALATSVTFQWSNTAPDLTFILQYSTDLKSWTDVPDAELATSIGGVSAELVQAELIWLNPVASPRLFFRLKVSRR